MRVFPLMRKRRANHDIAPIRLCFTSSITYPPMNDPSVTMWLHRAGEGEADALGQAYAAAYDDLKRTAHAQLRRGGGELDTTSLVNETYLKLAHADSFRPQDRQALLALSAHAMRQVLVDESTPALDVLELHELLTTLGQVDARAAEGVELRCFGGYTEAEIGDIQGTTVRTVQRDWRRSRAFLMAQMGSP